MNDQAAAIYFDHNATTAIAPAALLAMTQCLQQGPLNASSKHAQGERAKLLLQTARAQVAQFLGCTPPELIFTSSGTEANHQAILGALKLQPDKQHIISSEVEHPATLMLLRELQAQGYHLTLLPVDASGQLNLEALKDTLLPTTALVTLMWANNETGVLFPVLEAAQLCKERGVLFHTDAVQAVGKLPIDLKSTSIDLLSFSGHKLHAPAGTGGVFVRKGIKLPPWLQGHQERGRRGGTENVSGLVALGAACAGLQQHLVRDGERLAKLRDRLEQGVLARVPGTVVHGEVAARLNNTSSIGFGSLPNNVDAELILGRLDRLGIYASAGAACSSAGTKASHVLTAMGLAVPEALATIRFSLGSDNTEQQVDYLLEVLPGVVHELSQLCA